MRPRELVSRTQQEQRPTSVRWRLGIAPFLWAAGLGACASGASSTPEAGASRDATVRVHNPVGTMTIDVRTDAHADESYVLRPRSETWTMLPAVFERLGIEVAYSDPGTFTMGNAGTEIRRIEGKRLSTWLDCGYGTTAQANADTYTVHMSIMVTLGDVEQTGTEVGTRLEASAKPRSHSGHPVICTSKRTLEPRIAEVLKELVTGIGP